MRRALVWLNLYGREAVRHKLKNRPKMHFLCFLAIFWVGHFEFYFFKKKFFFCFILMKISHKLCVRMDGTQFLWLWWYTAKTQSPQTFQPAVYILPKVICKFLVVPICCNLVLFGSFITQSTRIFWNSNSPLPDWCHCHQTYKSYFCHL